MSESVMKLILDSPIALHWTQYVGNGYYSQDVFLGFFGGQMDHALSWRLTYNVSSNCIERSIDSRFKREKKMSGKFENIISFFGWNFRHRYRPIQERFVCGVVCHCVRPFHFYLFKKKKKETKKNLFSAFIFFRTREEDSDMKKKVLKQRRRSI